MEKKLTAKTLGLKLKQIREVRYPDRNAFIRASKLDYGAVEQTENGERWLRIDRIERWLTACGWTLASFFASLQEGEGPSEMVRQFATIVDLDPAFAKAVLTMASRGVVVKPEPIRKPTKRKRGEDA